MIKNDILDKLNKESKKVYKKKDINTNSPFNLLTDKEIAMVLAQRSRGLRVLKDLNQEDMSNKANLKNKSTYSNFEQTGTISLANLIKVARALGRLEQLEDLFVETPEDKLIKIEKGSISNKRVRKNKSINL